MGVEIINTLLLVFRRQIGEHDNLRAAAKVSSDCAAPEVG